MIQSFKVINNILLQPLCNNFGTEEEQYKKNYLTNSIKLLQIIWCYRAWSIPFFFGHNKCVIEPLPMS